MNAEQARSLVKEFGPYGTGQIYKSLLEGHKLPNGSVQRIDPQRQSVRELWEGLVGPLSQTLDNPMWREASGGALDATAFPSVTENLIASVSIAGYNEVEGVADRLVPRSYSPKTLTERIPGFTTAYGPKKVAPGEPYPASGLGEKYVTFEEAMRQGKEGFEILVTEEAIRFDQSNMIMERARNAGMTLNTERERRTIRAVLGIGADTGTTLSLVYFPAGTDTALYLAANSNLRTDAAPIYNHPGKTADSKLEDFTDLQEVMTVHAQNIKDDRDSGTTRPIMWRPNTILVPVSLVSTVSNVMDAMGVRITSFSTGATTTPEIETLTRRNPVQAIFGGQIPLPVVSPYVDEVSSTMWTVYDNRTAFVRVVAFPFETFRPIASEELRRRDVMMAVRVREWTYCVALDYRQTIRNNGA